MIPACFKTYAVSLLLLCMTTRADSLPSDRANTAEDKHDIDRGEEVEALISASKQTRMELLQLNAQAAARGERLHVRVETGRVAIASLEEAHFAQALTAANAAISAFVEWGAARAESIGYQVGYNDSELATMPTVEQFKKALCASLDTDLRKLSLSPARATEAASRLLPPERAQQFAAYVAARYGRGVASGRLAMAEEKAEREDWIDGVTSPFRKTIALVKDVTLTVVTDTLPRLFEVPRDLFTGDFDRLGDRSLLNNLTLNLIPAASHLAGVTLNDALAILPLQPVLGDAYVEEPKPVEASAEGVYGEAIVYINGMNVSKDAALSAGQTLSRSLRRRVVVIYDPCADAFTDLGVAAVDRFIPVVPMNSASRQLTYMLVHPEKYGRVSVVAHSRGNLVVRQAVLAAGILGRGNWAHDNLAWVALACPMTEAEITPRPKRLTILNHPDDVVPMAATGDRPTGIESSRAKGHGHGASSYIEDIKEDMLWPG
jgi:hypothetical protein